MPPKGKKTTGTSSSASKKKKSPQPTQKNPKGIRVKILGANGKIRWEWR